MGNPDTKLTTDELLRSLADSEETYALLKDIISSKNIPSNAQENIPKQEQQ